MPGIGKTALAAHWARMAAGRFPDGRLHVDLRGFDAVEAPLDPAEALRGMLTALGVPPARMPGRTDSLAGLYRSLLAGRRLLVLLDDAADTEQVRPLLPASPGSLTLVTSRNGLSGLIASGAHPLRLGLPSAADARAMLAAHLGHDRPTAEPEAADEIVARCGRLPLALRIVAARATGRPGRPGLPLPALAAELRHTRDSLDAFADTTGTPHTGTAFAGAAGTPHTRTAFAAPGGTPDSLPAPSAPSAPMRGSAPPTAPPPPTSARRPTSAPSSPARTVVCRRSTPGCSVCCRCTPAPTWTRTRQHPWPASRPVGPGCCSTTSPTPTSSPNTRRAATPSTTCCASSPPSGPGRTTRARVTSSPFMA